MEAVGCELLRRDIGSEVTRLNPLSHQLSDHVPKLLLGPSDPLVSMQKRGEFRVMVAMRLVRDQGKVLQYSPEPVDRPARLVADLRQMCEVTSDLAFVPRREDCLDV